MLFRSLVCIEVDNVAYSNSNWTNIDTQTSFSTNCSNSCSTVGINEYSFSSLILYPNPTNKDISINLKEIKTNLTTTLSNSLGQVILTRYFKSTNFFTIELDGPIGVYFLKLETSDGEFKIIKVIKK